MKLLFIGVVPDPALEKVLLSNGFAVTSVKRVPEKLPEGCDIAAIHPKSESSLKEVEKLRALGPDLWIALIVDKAKLRESDYQNALLKCDAKNDLWFSDTWQMMFWLSLQRMLQTHQALQETRKLQEEVQLLRSNYDELSQSSDRLILQLEKDVGLATNIQRSLLPKVSPEIPGVSLAVKYLPAAGLGGDYYDIFEFGDRKRFGVLLADSKTHGMAAALLSVLIKVRLEEMKDRFPNSHSFVEFVNREIQQLHKKDMAPLSLLYGILDRSTLTFRFTVAGPMRPLLWRDGKPAEFPVLGNPLLGTNDHFDFRENEVTLNPGDLMILHTDGLEAPLTQDHSTAFDKLVQILEKKKHSPDPLEVQNELMALIDRFVEKRPLADDLTVIHFAINARALYVAQSK